MNAPAPLFTPHWHAELELGYALCASATRPVLRRHSGPLRVQKHLYPEGPEVCQHIIVHPPGGIAGGDRLDISASVAAGAWAQLTAPVRPSGIAPSARRFRTCACASKPAPRWNGYRRRPSSTPRRRPS